jgi:hypothetical protein
MEARIFRTALLAALLIVSMGAKHKTPNFIIETRDPRLAEQLGQAAERYRRELAILWLGEPMPDWSHPCPVTIQVGSHLGAGGATTFLFDRGEVFGWRMSIQGSAERLLDSVLPHEITHMVFASHFRRPLPRWADEGAATTMEHPSERMKHRRMLVFYLKNGGGIPFDRMFGMTEYPRKMMLLYAQGYSLADYLIQKGGRRKFVQFLEEGLHSDRWSDTIQRHYSIATIRTLQDTWVAWVRQGSPRVQPENTPQIDLVAVNNKLPRPAPNLIYRSQSMDSSADRAERATDDVTESSEVAAHAQQIAQTNGSPYSGDGWHSVDGLHNPMSPIPPAMVSPPAAIRSQSAHPQPFQQPHQIILEWKQP